MKETSGNAAVLDRFVGTLGVGEPTTHRKLTLFPIYSKEAVEDGYLLLDGAMAASGFTVTETSEGGNVPELSVTNGLDMDVLLLDGEQLIGAKQNRIINTTIIIGKGRNVVIPVSCVEQGRWQYRSRKFSPAPASHLYADLRRMKSRAVSNSLREGRSFESDQGQIWQDISAKSARFSVDSPTGAMEDVFASRDRDLKAYEDAFRTYPGQVGFLAIIDGRVAGCDIFGVRSVFEKSFGKLIRGYILDALDSGPVSRRRPRTRQVDPGFESELAQAFLASIVASRKESFASVGDGNDVRFEGMAINGFGLTRGDQVIHVAAFAD